MPHMSDLKLNYKIQVSLIHNIKYNIKMDNLHVDKHKRIVQSKQNLKVVTV